MQRTITWLLVTGALIVWGLTDYVSTLRTCQYEQQEKYEQSSEKSCGLTQSLTYRGAEIIFKWIDRRHDFVTAAATIIIAFFTFTLWRATDRLWVAGERQAKLTKDSIELARQDFISTHRPKIRIRRIIISVSHFGAEFLSHGDKMEFEIKIANVGSSHAYLVEGYYEIRFYRPAVQDVSFGRQGNVLFTGEIQLAAGQHHTFTLTETVSLIDDKLGRRVWQFKEEGWAVMVAGEIVYRDSLNRRRNTGFIRECRTGKRFVPVKDPDYEYED